jgi:hypothetical protein
MHAVVKGDGACHVAGVDVRLTDADGRPISLWKNGISPVHAVAVRADDLQYRAGTDLLRRGDFESANLLGSHERAWLDGEHIRIDFAPGTGNESMLMRIDVPTGTTVRAGMKVFERTFRQSTPATVTGRIHSDADAEVKFYLQRRRSNDSLPDALSSGPLTEIGSLRVAAGAWQNFVFDHLFPRLSTRSIRLLIDVRPAAAADDNADPTTVLLDDLAWIEWHSPWLEGAQPLRNAPLATHLQLRRIP